jgi:hypothetical protein
VTIQEAATLARPIIESEVAKRITKWSVKNIPREKPLNLDGIKWYGPKTVRQNQVGSNFPIMVSG